MKLFESRKGVNTPARPPVITPDHSNSVFVNFPSPVPINVNVTLPNGVPLSGKLALEVVVTHHFPDALTVNLVKEHRLASFGFVESEPRKIKP